MRPSRQLPIAMYLLLLATCTTTRPPTLAGLCRDMVAAYGIDDNNPCELYERIESGTNESGRCGTPEGAIAQVSHGITLEQAHSIANWVSQYAKPDEGPCSYCESLHEVYVAPSASPSLFLQHVVMRGHPAIFPEYAHVSRPEYQEVLDQLHAIYRTHGPPNLTGSEHTYAPFFSAADYRGLEKFCKLDPLHFPRHLAWAEFRPQVTRRFDALIGDRRPRVIPDMLWDGTSAQRWVFLSSVGHGNKMHTDRIEDHGTWHAQLAGSKTWQLEPLPPCSETCSALQFTVHAGHVFVFDSNKWRHSTRCAGNQSNGTASPCINIAGDFYSPLCPKFMSSRLYGDTLRP